MDILKTIFPCLPIERAIQLPVNDENHHFITEKASPNSLTFNDEKPRLCSDEAAKSVVSTLKDTRESGPSLDAAIQSIVHQAGGWSEWLAKKILAALEKVLGSETLVHMSTVMQEAVAKAKDAASVFEKFEEDHPYEAEVLVTVIALGVLVILAPYMLEWLGFSELGPVEGIYSPPWPIVMK